jgi:hypothetical protein
MYDAMVKSRYESRGTMKTRFHKVGVAFDVEGGGFDVIIQDNTAVGGKIHVRPRRERGVADMGDEPESGETGDAWRE